MFVVRPMPKDILIHEVIYEEFVSKGRDGVVYRHPVTLEHVLVQPVSSIKRSGISDEVSFNSLMFFDCVNSTPLGVTFIKKSRITHNGEEMILNKVNPIYAFSLHHYELELI